MSEGKPKKPGTFEPSREVVGTYTMNALTNREVLIDAIAAIEGDIWKEVERENGQYSINGAIAKALSEPHGEGEIYGYGGTRRYFVRHDGSVYYSEGHGRHDTERARALGFKMLSEAPPRWPEF